MKRFAVGQRFTQPRDAVVDAFRDERVWRGLRDLPFVGDPSVRSFESAEVTSISVWYRVTIELPPLADRFIQPDKLSFVERSRLHLDGTGTFDIVPEHYPKLLKASGTTEIVSGEGGSERHVRGSVDVNLGWSGKLFEGPVEDAIANGLVEALNAQARQVFT